MLTSNQDTDGIGNPVVEQFRVVFVPSITVMFSSGHMTDPSINKKETDCCSLTLFYKILIQSE